MKILLAILTTSGLPYLRRAIHSAQNQHPGGVNYETIVVVNTQDDGYALEAARLCGELGVQHVRTECDGTHPTGVQSVHDLFLAGYTRCGYVTQLDGDDWLYPTWSLSVREHLRLAPDLDAVWLVPIDQIHGSDKGVSWVTPAGAVAGVWGTSLWGPWRETEQPMGPGRDPMWDQPTPVVPAMPRLISRRAARLCPWTPAPPIYGDYLMLMRQLAAHIRGDLRCWVSMASDWMIVDRGNPDSVQRSHDFHETAARMKELALTEIDPERSWIGELPVMYPAMQLTVAEKRPWINSTEGV